MAPKDHDVSLGSFSSCLLRKQVGLTCRPTCLFLAAKTTNFPVPLDVFTPKFKGLTQGDILDTEFLLAQSLGFEFWIRGPEKALRGWGLEFQVCPCVHAR
jgi:cyclin H